MNKLFTRLAIVAALCTLLVAGSSCSLFKKGSRARVNTLLVTGNYLKPRLLCELAQYRSKQPIILFEQDEESDAPRLFYLSASNKSEEISAAKFAGFVKYLNPKTVIFLGDESCVPAEYVNQVQDDFRVMHLNSTDWDRNAQMLGEILKQPKLNRLYLEYLQRYEEKAVPATPAQ